MKLMVIDCISELLSDNSITNYSGDTVVESSLTLLEDESPSDVKAKILRLIREQFPDYEGQFFFASRRNKNRLSIAADQDLDARGMYTLKGSGSVYVVLENSLTISEDEVSTTFFLCMLLSGPGSRAIPRNCLEQVKFTFWIIHMPYESILIKIYDMISA